MFAGGIESEGRDHFDRTKPLYRLIGELVELGVADRPLGLQHTHLGLNGGLGVDRGKVFRLGPNRRQRRSLRRLDLRLGFHGVGLGLGVIGVLSLERRRHAQPGAIERGLGLGDAGLCRRQLPAGFDDRRVGRLAECRRDHAERECQTEQNAWGLHRVSSDSCAPLQGT